MILMFKFVMGRLPKSFQTIFKKNPEPLGVGTKQTNHVYINMCISQIAPNSIGNKGTL